MRIVAPVVEKPEDISKNASTYDGISPLIHSGKAPTRASRIQLSAVAAKPAF